MFLEKKFSENKQISITVQSKKNFLKNLPASKIQLPFKVKFFFSKICQQSDFNYRSERVFFLENSQIDRL
jgi:hypothetical protein